MRKRRALMRYVRLTKVFIEKHRPDTFSTARLVVAQTATRARMPPLDLKRLFEEERARRRAAVGASTSEEAAPDRLEALEARPTYSMADHDVGRFAARPISGLHYVPEFVTEAEEKALLRSIRATENDHRWTRDGGRRVGNWGGKPSDAEVTEPLPVWATAVVDGLFARAVFVADRDGDEAKTAADERPNHVLVNEYRAPAGISPHNDGSVYESKVAILTLEGDALIDFWENDGSPTAAEPDDEAMDAEEKETRGDDRRPSSPSPRAQVALRRRSLLVYEGEAYDLRHGIRRGFVDVITRACVNAKRARVAVGDTVPRGERRVSVVFVIKANRRR